MMKSVTLPGSKLLIVVRLTANAFVTVQISIHRVIFAQCGLNVPCLLLATHNEESLFWGLCPECIMSKGHELQQHNYVSYGTHQQ